MFDELLTGPRTKRKRIQRKDESDDDAAEDLAAFKGD